MRRVPVALFLLCVMAFTHSYAEIRLGENTTIVFATVGEAKQILTSRDEFVERMSPFDRASRMKTDNDVSEEDYLEFVGKNVLPWNDSERHTVTAAFHEIQKELETLYLPFPKKLFIVKTTGKEEGGATYTRANAIVFAKADLKAPIAEIQKMLGHELFHIMSRANPELREKLYAVIGFVKCSEVTFPSELTSRKITNPDAPKNEHCILLTVNGKKSWSIPILFSSSEKYDTVRGGEFFDYLKIQLLLVERVDNSSTVTPIHGKKPKLVGMQQVSGFLEQVGRNTGYIIHPEEILADNFALLLLRERNLPSPEIIKNMEQVLEDNRIAEQHAAADADKPRR